MGRRVLLSSLVLVMLLTTAACKDITATYKPASFGASAQEQAMVGALTSRYGDLRESGPPRFLEPMMTSRVENGMPADRVTKYSKDTKKLFAWFVYDNFSEDTLEIEWIFVPQSHSIHTFKSQTGKDFGRGTFILEQPDGGWPTGAYKVVIRGRGVTSTISFEIVSGTTVSTPVLLAGNKVELPKQPGWYLISTDYIISTIDMTLHPPGGYYSTASSMYHYAKGEGQKGDFTVKFWRTNLEGRSLAGSISRSTWEDPPARIDADTKISMQVSREYEGGNTWGQSGLSVKFDVPDMKPGYSSAGKIDFVDASGKASWHTYSGPVTSGIVIPAGKPGDKRVIMVFLEGYGYQYTYEWRD